MQDMILDDHLIGKRCHLDKHKGTIRYVGIVSPHEGTWIGIEWDTKRGKHDGSTENGERYFQCRDKHGSFVRPHKISLGVDVIRALNDAYGEGSFDEEANRMILHKETKQETFVELVGFDKIAKMQSDFSKLRIIELSGMFISSGHNVDCLSQAAPNLTSLDLRNNLLSSLQEIVKIAGSLQKLETLDISENLLSDFNTKNNLSTDFPKLKQLFANRMNLTWKTTLEVMVLSTTIEELYVCYNNIDSVYYEEKLDTLKVINVQGNQITNCSDISKLLELKNMMKIILNENDIKELKFSGNKEIHSTVTSLSICNIGLTSWSSINELNHLKNFQYLKIRDNPFMDGMTSFLTRQQLIARLTNLKKCNASKVTEDERKKAEVAYLKIYYDDYNQSKIKNDLETFKFNHPRYLELIEKYGEPAEEKKAKHVLKDNLLELHFECPDDSSKGKKSKSVPASMTVQQLKGMLQRLFKVPSSKQTISYKDEKNDREIEMNDNMKQLLYYAIKSHDIVLLRWNV